MATSWSFIPVLGNYDEDSFAFFGNLAEDVVPRSAAAAFQGNPRAGRVKWSMILENPDPTVNPTDATQPVIVVQTPFSALTPDVVNKINSLVPIATLTPMGATTFAQGVFAWPTQNPGVVNTAAAIEAQFPSLAGKLNPSYLYAVVALKVSAPAAAFISAILTIDFSHSIAS